MQLSPDATVFHVNVNGKDTTFAARKVTRITLNGYRGDDNLMLQEYNAPAIDVPAFIYGGGNDTLTGGSGDDVISGHTGDDDIAGGGGANRMDGGQGTDTIEGVQEGSQAEQNFIATGSTQGASPTAGATNGIARSRHWRRRPWTFIVYRS